MSCSNIYVTGRKGWEAAQAQASYLQHISQSQTIRFLKFTRESVAHRRFISFWLAWMATMWSQPHSASKSNIASEWSCTQQAEVKLRQSWPSILWKTKCWWNMQQCQFGMTAAGCDKLQALSVELLEPLKSSMQDKTGEASVWKFEKAHSILYNVWEISCLAGLRT